jgi:hypothetical protein
MLALLAFSTFVIDYGVYWTARRQAQNAADSGALAGALAMALDDAPAVDDGLAEDAARAAAQSNRVWGQSANLLPEDITFVPCPETPSATCIRVEVWRHEARGNALPMFFGNLVNLATQNVRAVAMAEVAPGTATDCLKPFGVPDYYDPALGVDSYSYPGYTLDTHLGTEVLLKSAPQTEIARLSPGWFRLLDLVGEGQAGGTGSEEGTKAQIMSCVADVLGVGDVLIDQNGNLGNNVSDAVNQLFELDDEAYFDGQKVVNSCADDGSCYKIVYTGNGNQTAEVPDPGRTYSPRILMIPVFDPVKFFADGTIEVVNVFGFFIEERMGNPPDFELRGTLVEHPGMIGDGAGTVPGSAAFLKVVRLIR